MLKKKLKLASTLSNSLPINHPPEEEDDEHLYKRDINTNDNITSHFFTTTSENLSTKPAFWEQLFDIETNLSSTLKSMNFIQGKIAAVYNPLEYAANLHCAFLKKYLKQCPVKILFIGMNPGPWGMCQTGVPFGYVPAVRDWMNLSGSVGKPEAEIPARPVSGLLCAKAEQSGQRFWGLFRDLCGGNLDLFFENCFIYNFCPLAFFQLSGCNVTPAEIKGPAKHTLQEICSNSMREAIELLRPEQIISIGRYAEDRVKVLQKSNSINSNIQHKCIPHPSPRSLNNTNWNEKAAKWLIDNDVMPFVKGRLV